MAWECVECGKQFADKKTAARHERGHLLQDYRNPGSTDKEMAQRFIREEMHAGYPRRQAIAIGLSRARALGLRVPRRRGSR